MAQEGLEPSASLVLSESGLPIAYRANGDGAQGGIRTHIQLGFGHRPKSGRVCFAVCVPELEERKRWDSNPQAACAATCFQDRLLIRPVRFRHNRGSNSSDAFTDDLSSVSAMMRSRRLPNSALSVHLPGTNGRRVFP